MRVLRITAHNKRLAAKLKMLSLGMEYNEGWEIEDCQRLRVYSC